MYKPYWRHPRTTQERRATGKRNKWGRAKRNFVNLPTVRDDISVHYEKSWKSKRKTQYRPKGRGTRYSMYIEYERRLSWRGEDNLSRLEKYFERYDIPYNIVEDREVHYEWKVRTGQWMCVLVYVLVLDPENNNRAKLDENGERIYRYRYEHQWVQYKKPIFYTQKYRGTLKGHIITYWTHKNIVLPI